LVIIQGNLLIQLDVDGAVAGRVRHHKPIDDEVDDEDLMVGVDGLRVCEVLEVLLQYPLRPLLVVLAETLVQLHRLRPPTLEVGVLEEGFNEGNRLIQEVRLLQLGEREVAYDQVLYQ
jgi:hypothetical protein